MQILCLSILLLCSMKKIIPFLFIVLVGACKQKQTVNLIAELAKADSLLKAGTLDTALMAYNTVLQADSFNVHARLQRALLFVQSNQYANAVNETDTIIKLTDTVLAYYYRATALRLMGKSEAAIADYTVAVKKQPNEFDYIHERGMAYFNMERYDAAQADFETARVLNPLNAHVQLSIGSTYALTGDKSKALNYYNRALILQPNYYQALLVKCVLLNETKQTDSCLSTLYTAINYFPDSAQFYKMRIDILFKKKMYEEAIIDAGVLIRVMPNKAPYYNVRGFCKLEQNKVDDALLDFERALQQDTAYAYAWNNRGYCRYLENDFSGAMQDIDHSIQLNPSNSYAYRNLALVQIALKHKKEACKSLDMAITTGFVKEFGNEVLQLKAKNCR
jgi:tetratricopeptide (TPR) repeat protein